ncbi:DUF4249 family protein [Draconibacterium sediminis]|uniref:DUF4249 family protein n=1 Tax=Draconibacterium sediminis TaxID=1544798 RepID=UPI0026EEB6CD|nr:DUF4249 family protein [Draconibacterium sediminis]
MKKFILKYLLLSFSVFLIVPSCIKDMEIDVTENNKEVIVSCLFNPQNKWEITLYETKNIQENDDIFIEDANVEITAESGEVITLNYSGDKGVYKSDDYPEMGKSYTLKINIPGRNEITAESTVPDFVKATVPDFEIKWVKYLYPNDLMDYDVFPLQVDFGETVQDARFLFRAHTFNPREGYNRYMLTTSSLKKLSEQGLPSHVYDVLLKIADEWRINSFDFYSPVFNLIDNYQTQSKFSSLLGRELKEKTVNVRAKEAFASNQCFEDDNWLNNISYDTHTVIGKGQNISKANLLYADSNLKYSMENNKKKNMEFWIEIIRGDSDYIKYYRTYILQVSQRINPYSEPVMVHSNINNATGIFAGYNRQMIHLFTY